MSRAFNRKARKGSRKGRKENCPPEASESDQGSPLKFWYA